MKALQKIYQETIPSSIVMDYISLYTEIGKEEEYKEKLNNNSKVLSDSALKLDIISAYRIFFPEFKITDSKLNQIINGKIIPRDDASIIAYNLSIIFNKIRLEKLVLDEMEIYNLSRLLYKGYMNLVNYNQYKRPKDNEDTYQSRLKNIMEIYKEKKESGKIESITLNTAFLIDFLKLSPFKESNNAIGLIYFYALNFHSNINCFKYKSFFEYLKNHYALYEEALNSAFYQYEDGLTNPIKLIKYMLKCANDSFISLHQDVLNTSFDKKNSKSLTIIQIIYSFKESFTKEDIRSKARGVSDTTIERALKELQERNVIMPTGTGRSAKWVRIDNDYLINQDIDFNS